VCPRIATSFGLRRASRRCICLIGVPPRRCRSHKPSLYCRQGTSHKPSLEPHPPSQAAPACCRCLQSAVGSFLCFASVLLLYVSCACAFSACATCLVSWHALHTPVSGHVMGGGVTECCRKTHLVMHLFLKHACIVERCMCCQEVHAKAAH